MTSPALLAVFAALALASPRAPPGDPGFPSVDAAGEQGLLPASPALPAWTLGTWRQGPAEAVRTAGPQRRASWLVPRVDAGEVQHGMVRASVAYGSGTPDFSVLVRFRPGTGKPEEFDAYGVSVEPGRLFLQRFARGAAYKMGPSVPLKGMKGPRALEVVVFLAGPHLAAFLYDAKTLELLGSLAHHDPHLRTGHVGVRVDGARAAVFSVKRLSVTSGAAPAAAKEAFAPSPERRVRVASEDLGRVPDALRGGVLEPLPGERGPGVELLLRRPSDVERLRRSGVTVLAESGLVAWMHLDARYRRALVARPGEVPPPGTYKDWEMVEAQLRAAAADHPDLVRLHALGTTHQGRTVWAARVTESPDGPVDRPAVFINGGHHGDELLGTEFALDALAEVLARRETPAGRRLLGAVDLWFVPLVNPDGNAAFVRLSRAAGRKNGRDLDGDGRYDVDEGVDLNRNYPFEWGGLGEEGSRSRRSSDLYRGPAEASEPETQAVVGLARAQHFVASLSFHTVATAVLYPYTVGRARPPEPNVARQVAEGLVAGGPRQVSGRPYRVLPRLYPVDGTDQDWHHWAHGTVALLVEGPVHNPLEPDKARAAVEGTRLLVTRLLERVVDGPRLSLRVRGEDGNPLEAEVRVEGLQLHAGERWKSRERDGRFDLLVPSPGPWRVEVHREGFHPATAELRVGELSEVRLRPAG
ncbi:MAG: hypothetical protein RL653_878 [Pseudomonadota bacterium]